MAFPDRVIGRMVSPLWSQIAAAAPLSPPGSGNTGQGIAPTHFGIPERIPELTFIVNALPGDNGFISSATDYHRTYGLNPQSFQSLEGLIGALRQPATHIGRLRIVGHVGLSDASEANLNAAFFNGGPRVITEEMLRGFGVSDEAGLRAIIDQTNFLNPTAPVLNNFVEEIINVLQSLNPDVLAPFGDITHQNISGDFEQFMFSCSDLMVTNLATITITDTGNNATTANRNVMKALLRKLGDIYIDRVVGTTVRAGAVSLQDLNNLRTAIEGINNIELNFLSRGIPVFSDLTSRILSGLRGDAATRSKLAPFCLEASGSPTDPRLQQFFAACSDLLFVKLVPSNDLTFDGNPMVNGGQPKNRLNAALNAVANQRRGQLVGTTLCGSTQLTATHFNDLRSAILGLSMSDIMMSSLGSAGFPNNPPPFSFPTARAFTQMSTATAGVGRSFRQRLNQVKARFDENSFIDIRGCRIGQDTDYLEALRVFFGRTNHLPTISGPDLFQNFSIAGGIRLADEAAIDTLFGNGDNSQGQNHSDQLVQTLFDEVRTLSGLDTHMDFWERVSALSDFEFAALVWKGDLPVLPIEAPRLDNFDNLDFSDTMTRIAEIFNLAASRPTPATLTRIENVHAAMAALQTEIANIQRIAGQASPVPADLEQSHGRLLQVSQQLSLTIVPAAPPAGLNATQLQAWATQLKTHFEQTIIANGAANNTELTTFRQALHAKVREPRSTDSTAAVNGRSDFRYFFFIGLALLVEPVGNWWFYVLTAHQHAAIRSFMHAHWQDAPPSGNQIAASSISQNRSRQLAILSDLDDERNSVDDFVNPYPDYNRHIVVRPRP